MKDNAVLAAADAIEAYQRGGIPPVILNRCAGFNLNAEALKEIADELKRRDERGEPDEATDDA